jgi:hypothetical protein
MEQTIHFPGHTPWTIAFVAALAAVGLLLYVWRVRGSLERRDRWILTVLRLVAVAGILGGYLQPSLRYEEVVRRRSVVPVLVDESASMGVRGADGSTRSEAVARLFAEHAGWFEDLERQHEVQYFAFADRVRPIERAALSTPLDPAGGATDLLGALRNVTDRFRREDLGGFLVLSDGVDTGTLATLVDESGALLPAGRMAAEGLPGPLVAVVPAPQSPPRDVDIRRVQGLEYLLTRNVARVHVELGVQGIDGGVLAVSLSEGGETLARADVPVPSAGTTTAVDLTFLPRNPGPHVYQVAVEPLPGEASLANNLRTVPATVVRDALRILHVAGHASWDERFLREYLMRRRGVELVSFHTLRADEPMTESEADTTLVPFPAEEIFVTRVEGFDLVLLQDYEIPHPDRTRFSESLERYVRAGGAFLMVGGSKVLGAQGPWPTHLEPLLPVLPPRVAGTGMSEGTFPVEATPEGRRHPALANPQLTQMLAAAPPLTALNVVGGTVPGAITLLRAAPDLPLSAIGRPPVLVLAPHGEGRTAVLLTDTLWRWSFDPFADATYRKVLDGLLVYLTRDPAGAPLRLTVQTPRVLPGRPVDIVLRAAAGVKTARVSLQHRAPDGSFEPPETSREIALDDEGSARLALVPSGPGTWRVVAAAVEGEAPLSAEDLCVVGPLPAEVGESEPPLRHLSIFAMATKGRTAGPDLPTVESLPFRPEVVARVGVSADEPLWNHPLVFLLLLAVLGLEWYVERKIGYT